MKIAAIAFTKNGGRIVKMINTAVFTAQKKPFRIKAERLLQYIQSLKQKIVDKEIDINVLERIINHVEKFETVSGGEIKKSVGKLDSIISISVLAYEDVHFREILNMSNGKYVNMESSIVQWHQNNDKWYQFWTPLQRIGKDEKEPYKVISPFLMKQARVIMFIFEEKRKESFDQLKQLLTMKKQYFDTENIIVVGINDENNPNVGLKEEQKQHVINHLKNKIEMKAKYFQWNSSSSKMNDLIAAIDEFF